MVPDDIMSLQWKDIWSNGVRLSPESVIELIRGQIRSKFAIYILKSQDAAKNFAD